MTDSHRLEEDVVRVLRDDGTLDGARDPLLSPAEVLEVYGHMLKTRILDERLLTLQRQGRIGFHVGALGEEASIIGAAWPLGAEDWIFPCYREVGAALMRGLPLQAFVDNVFGNANDVVKGRQMPDHHTCRAAGYASTSSPVGTQIPHAVGVGWAARLRGDKVVSLCFFGDGATSTNDFHAGMNFAAVFSVPVIFLCRNNGWAISTPPERQTRSRTFAEKGAAYAVPSVRVDGNDVFAVISVVRDALARAREGHGPTLIEALTYRMGAHTSSDDPNRYRTQDELEPWTRRDPLERVRRWLLDNGHLTHAEDDAMKQDIDTRFRQAVAVAEAAPAPSLESLHADVYHDVPWHLAEQRDELIRGPRAAAHG